MKRERRWMIAPFCLFLLVAVPLSSTSACAGEDPDVAAKASYTKGKAAFEKGRFQEAHDLFKKAFLVSQRPELLFNMASCLDRLDRPHDAADELRSFLRTAPDDPDRPGIERRISTLEEKQRLLDAEKRAAERQPLTPVEPVVTAPARVPAAALDAPSPADEAPRPRRTLYVALVAGAGAILVGGIVVGLAVGLGSTTVEEGLVAGNIDPGFQRITP